MSICVSQSSTHRHACKDRDSPSGGNGDPSRVLCLRAAQQRTRNDTELTVLVPRRRFARRWHQLLLHDRTSAGLVRVLGDLNNVNVTIVPYQLGRSAHTHPAVGPETARPRASV